ncbi:MAG: hypothetical protein FWD34_04190 [Oscillospiraceae bacterium]|nr:hypothetical protein [Oscillospiraceae bacterium]
MKGILIALTIGFTIGVAVGVLISPVKNGVNVNTITKNFVYNKNNPEPVIKPVVRKYNKPDKLFENEELLTQIIN